MKVRFVILICSILAICGCTVPDSAIGGVWVVTGVRFAGDSAMSEGDATKWMGRSLSIGDVSMSLKGERLSGCRVSETEVEATRYFADGFKIRPAELGFTDPKVHIFEIHDAGGQLWVAPGATIMVGKKLVLTCWDGVFFVLQKKKPNKNVP